MTSLASDCLPFNEASHSRRDGTNRRLLTIVLALGLLPAGCPTGEPPADDDDSAGIGDDDDSTPTLDPVADILGVVNLTNVRQPEGTDYVDFSGAFGDFAGVDLTLLSPTAYISTWGVDAPLWRLDLGGWPMPLFGEELVLDLFEFEPWRPDQQLWWDAGDRIALGPYLSLRYADDAVLAYQVDDPLNPGGDAWNTGGSASFATSGGDPIVAWSSDPTVTLPDDMELVTPLPGSVIETPAAQEYTVSWNPMDDGASVSVVLHQGLNVSYIAHVEDDGSHTIPATVLHDDFGPGEVTLIVSRLLETVVAHPQGDVIVRVRSEERATLALLEDLVLSPAYGSAGQTVDVDVNWFTGSIDAETTFDFGEGITIDGVTPNGSDPQRATVTLSIASNAPLGTHDVTVANGGESIEALDAFTVLDLEPTNTCAEADALGPLPMGTFVGSTDGLENTLSSGYACIDWSLNGADAVYAIELQEGLPVRITATMPDPGDAALALLSSCGDPATAVACADDGFEGDTEAIVFTPPETGTYYVVVDGYFLSGFGIPSSPFELTLETLTPPSPITPPWVVPGVSSQLTIERETAWSAGLGPGDVDMGPDITVSNAQSAGTTLTVQVTADGLATLGPVDVTVADTPSVTFEDALVITELPGNDSCAAADSWGETAFDAQPHVGWSASGTNTLDETGCFTWTSPGREVVHALDLTAGQTVNVSLTSAQDTQLYVVTDCADVANTCISDASSDDGFDGDPEAIVDWEVPATGRYYLVVDLFTPSEEPNWEYVLTVDVQ